MRRYLKIGAFTIAILAVGYLIGSGSIGNLLRFGDETTQQMAEQAEADRIRAEADVEASEALRAISDPNSGVDVPQGSNGERE